MRVGFVGVGKFSRQLLRGWLEHGVLRGENVRVTARSEETRRKLDEALHEDPPVWCDDIADVAVSDVIVIALPPRTVPEVLPALAAHADGRLFIIFAAGVPLTTLYEGLGSHVRAIRCMPNTPVRVGAGITPYARSSHATVDDVETFRHLFDAVGRTVEVDEKHLDAITAVSGSGPAYVYHFMEALSQAAVEQGLSEELAHELVAQTFIGAARMVQETRIAPLALAAQVKTPGGTTLAACEVLDEGNLNGLVVRAIAAARKRAHDLGH